MQDEVKKLIEDAAHRAAQEVYGIGSEMNYFRATETLLHNYKRLQALLSDWQGYVAVEPQQRSKSVVVMSSGSRVRVDPCEVEEAAVISRAEAYERICVQFRTIDRVVKLFEKQKEFAVIRLYYFGEDIHGNERTDKKVYTWDDVAFALEDAGLLHDVKTARRWRNRIVSDMAVCLFGTPAALSVASHNAKTKPET